jgi:hypothetical protein
MWKKILAALMVVGFVGKFLNKKSVRKSILKSKFLNQKIRKGNHSWKRFFRENKMAYGLLAITIVSGFFGNFFEQYSYFFRTSLINMRPVEFTGTVSPIEKVPNWSTLSDAEFRMTFDELPKSKLIDIPPYDLEMMRKGKVWKKDNGDERNVYITYPVPNLGNYKLDGTENSGSHPGIDIKIPVGTPVRAIANGVVTKVESLQTGYGKHIVIAHVGFPDPKNTNKTTNLFSAYAHLSELNVKVGEEVKKGQVIAKSGQSGMVTAPHLHFQIDNAEAPYHPYWPFSWNDVKNAGLSSYFDAVKTGLGKSSALKYTEHPMNFVAKFKDESNIPSNLVASVDDHIVIDSSVTASATVETPMKSSAPTTTTTVNTNERNRVVKTQNDLEFVHNRIFVPGESKTVQLKLCDTCVATARIEIGSTLRGYIEIEPKSLEADDFKNGVADIVVTTNSDQIFKLTASGNFGKLKSESLRAQVFKDVDANNKYAEAIEYLYNKDVIKGYADGTFKPDGNLNRAEAVKIILIGNEIEINTTKTSKFPDVAKTEWFASFVNTAVSRGIVSGYSDGNFRPGNTISRAEFLKVAVLTAGFNPITPTSDPYPDVKKSDWFAPFFDLAKKQDLLSAKKGGYMAPSQNITREEAADIIYKLSKLKN